MSFFCWSIKSLFDIYIEKKKSSEWSKIVENDQINILKDLKRMRVLHKDALLNSEYIDNVYSFNDQLCNKRGLTLVSTKYYDFADSIMKQIRSYEIFEGLGKEGSGLLMICNYRINSLNVTMISILLTKSSLTCTNKFGIFLHVRFKTLIKQFTDSDKGQYVKKDSNVSHRTSLKTMAKKRLQIMHQKQSTSLK